MTTRATLQLVKNVASAVLTSRRPVSPVKGLISTFTGEWTSRPEKATLRPKLFVQSAQGLLCGAGRHSKSQVIADFASKRPLIRTLESCRSVKIVIRFACLNLT